MSSEPSLAEPLIHISPRRSAIWRLSAVYFIAFFAIAVIFTAAAVGLVRAKNAERARALVSADLEAMQDKIDGGPAEIRIAKATAIVLARSADWRDPRFYRLARRERTLAGTLPAGARLKPAGGGWYALEGRRGVALQSDLGAGAALTVGRLTDDSEIETELGRIALGSLVLAALCAFVVGPWASRRIVRKVEAVNAVCRQVETGDLSARAEGIQTPDEFGALARHVNAMLERIDGLVTGLSDVSNRVAHDLRTPMARLKSDLERAARAETLEQARAMAGVAAAEADEILQSFEALLDIAEVEAGSAGRLTPMRLDQAATDAADLYAAVAEDRKVALSVEVQPAPMLGERSLVIRLIANLLDNAIKFSSEGGSVRVRVAAGVGECVLTIEDQGPGVPAEERERILRRFTRGSAAGVVPGHGLGLALVVAVAKRHGAKLRLENLEPGLQVRVAFQRFAGDGG